MTDDKPKLKLVNRNIEGLKMVPANGVFGGRTPDGDLVVYVTFEHPQIQTEIVQELRDGKPVPVPRDPKEPIVIVRECQIALVLSPTSAKTIAEWILGRLSAPQPKTPADAKTQLDYYT